MQTQLGGARMGLQAFTIGQFSGNLAQHLRTCFADLDQAGAFLEVIDAERAGKARRAAGGQHVIGGQRSSHPGFRW